ncbi:hypothetical protein [Rhodococcus sp. 11-3]|uniref:hypothetical protein n=1 Tax=Rhodococcus sp. 11-3 TaxID=2854796 RepID=UPI00203B3A47|nr:hypothetical protein [Rhodococcus sp. 11-3]USC17064.1 hypothetical protein KZJ41_09430 [Rhodococcus sp. 11-3]
MSAPTRDRTGRPKQKTFRRFEIVYQIGQRTSSITVVARDVAEALQTSWAATEMPTRTIRSITEIGG